MLPPTVASRVLARMRAPARDGMSRREIEVRGLMARGCANKQAAARLFVSEETVKTTCCTPRPSWV